jgi:hypothetical protein
VLVNEYNNQLIYALHTTYASKSVLYCPISDNVFLKDFYFCSGLLKGHPTRGALGKNMAAIAIGYILGKWSYQGKCREKILALENSPLANAFRRQQQQAKRGGSFTDAVSDT